MLIPPFRGLIPKTPFRDFKTRGYLRNAFRVKKPEEIKILENNYFQVNFQPSLVELRNARDIEYKHIKQTHKNLFRNLYPWAGQDRHQTTPGLDISKNGYERMFAPSDLIESIVRDALKKGQDYDYFREHPGAVMGLLAHAPPFLEGNGRTIMLVHAELCHRSEFSIDWQNTNKNDYLKALTSEIYRPDLRELDQYLRSCLKRVR